MKTMEQEYHLLEEETYREQQQLHLMEQFSTLQNKFASRLDHLTLAEKKQVVRLLVEEVLVESVHESRIVKHVIPLAKRFPLRSGSSVPSACQCLLGYRAGLMVCHRGHAALPRLRCDPAVRRWHAGTGVKQIR